MPVDLDALDALEKRATPGRWIAGDCHVVKDGNPCWCKWIGTDKDPSGDTEWIAATGCVSAKDADLIAALRNAAPALIRVAKAAREWRAAYLADGDDEEPPFITKLDIAAGELSDAVRALKGEGRKDENDG